MFVLFGRRARVKRKRGGRRETRLCPDCDATATFYEADEKEAFHVFLIEVYAGKDTVWICSACEENMPWEATLEPVLSARERAKRSAKQQKAEATSARHKAKAERNKAKAAARQERELDDELVRLKARIDSE